MARSHPPTLIRIAERTLAEDTALARGDRILIAVSGGGDSTAMLHVLAGLAPRLGVTLVAHGVDHGLRAEAGAELDQAEELATRLDVPFAVTRVEVRPGGNVQARARTARREALLAAKARHDATYIATAHHANDRAETVLIRLLHGGTPAALAVLPAVDGVWMRPLIRARKSDVLTHLARHALSHAEDPSNENRRFLRVRVRHELLPLLEQLSPSIVDHLTALADEIAAEPLPAVLDEDGRKVPLGRAHSRALERALRLGFAARIRLSEGRELRVDPRAGALCVEKSLKKPLPSSDNWNKGGAKRRKSG